MTTVDAKDVVAYMLEGGPMPQLKLQKLLYYCQALARVWYRQDLFFDPIEAWVNGPVVRSIWNSHSYEYMVENERDGDPHRLDEDCRRVIDTVVKTYGNYEAWELVRFVHMDKPWIDARKGLEAREHGYRLISTADMETFYRQKWSPA